MSLPCRQGLARLHSSSKRALLGAAGAAACRQTAAAASSTTATAAAAAADDVTAAAPPLVPGTTFTATKLFSPADVASFASVTGDGNPIHVDDAAARRQGLPAAVLPGLLSASLFPAIIGSHFPGAVYLTQTLKFKQFALVCVGGGGATLARWLSRLWSAHLCLAWLAGASVYPLPLCRCCCSCCSPQVGDSLTATLTVERCSGSRVSFRTLCCRDGPGLGTGAGAVVVEGTALALISPPPLPPR